MEGHQNTTGGKIVIGVESVFPGCLSLTFASLTFASLTRMSRSFLYLIRDYIVAFSARRLFPCLFTLSILCGDAHSELYIRTGGSSRTSTLVETYSARDRSHADCFLSCPNDTKKKLHR